jgi:hypothetical protein
MATKYGGYMGKILQNDLTTETAREYPFTDRQRRETLGGEDSGLSYSPQRTDRRHRGADVPGGRRVKEDHYGNAL